MTNELHLVLPATVIILGAVNSCSKKKTHVVMGKKKVNLNLPIVFNISFLCAVHFCCLW